MSIGRAGLPTTVLPAATLLVTTAPMPAPLQTKQVYAKETQLLKKELAQIIPIIDPTAGQGICLHTLDDLRMDVSRIAA